MEQGRQRAVTLIELVVVIAIVGLILTFGIPMYTTNVRKVNVSQMVNKLGTFKLALVDAYTANGEWPASLNGATAPATVADTSLDNAVNFRYNTDDNKAWWGYQMSSEYGSGWVFMFVIANEDGSFNTHCGRMSSSCTFGSCNSDAYYPAGCDESNLATTYSLGDT